MLVHHLRAEHVQAREQPAAARRALVGDALRRHAVGEMLVVNRARKSVGISGKRVDRIGCQCVAQRLFGC